MTRAVVVNFTGDPVFLTYWLRMYEKYIAPHIDTFYVWFYYNKDYISEELLQYQLDLLHNSSKIYLIDNVSDSLPETANKEILTKYVTEDNIFLTEADTFIFNDKYIGELFNKLEEDSNGIIAPIYNGLMSAPLRSVLHCDGFARNFTFIKKELLEDTDINFYPYIIEKETPILSLPLPSPQVMDCFGYMMVQLIENSFKKNKNIVYLNNHDFTSSYHSLNLSNNPYIHIRQMNSSILGFGTAHWKRIANKDTEIMEYYRSQCSNASGRIIVEKIVAFRQIMADIIDDKISKEFITLYKQAMNNIVECCEADKQKINNIYSYFYPKMVIND